MKTKQFKIRALRLALTTTLATGAIIYGTESRAAADTNTLQISAEILETCDITTTPVTFGEYDPVVLHNTTNLDNTAGQITVLCSAGTVATILLDDGANQAAGSTAAVPLRQMIAGAGQFLSYNLYKDSVGGTVWGGDVATGLLTTTAFTGTNSQIMTVFASIPAGQTAAPVGNYTDTVIVTASY